MPRFGMKSQSRSPKSTT